MHAPQPPHSLADLRRDYKRATLSAATLPNQPQALFRQWLDEAQAAAVPEPNAMVLATVDPSGQPFTRTVLLKRMDDKGLVFFTNFESRKAAHIADNARVSLLFLWLDLERQVSINGTAARISSAESLAYFITRPLGSRLGAWTSKQSAVISSRAILESKLAELKRKFANGDVPLPDFWGGFRVEPLSFEFWQGRQNRLHDRFLYARADNASTWHSQRLSP